MTFDQKTELRLIRQSYAIAGLLVMGFVAACLVLL